MIDRVFGNDEWPWVGCRQAIAEACRARVAWFRLSLAAAVGAVLLVIGCESAPSTTAYRHDRASVSAEDSFEKALELIEQMHEFQSEQTISQVAYNLNRWLEVQSADQQWLRDPLSSDPELDYLLRLPSLAKLAELDVTTSDVRYLQESRWLNNIAKWAVNCPPSFELEQWLAELPQAMDVDQAKKLNAAARLFDWTIRNIQLQPLLQPGPARRNTRLPPAAQAIPGPGYNLLPWQNLILGYGDAWQRGRIAILLMRQADIPAVMLATPRGENNELTPWAVAAVVNNQLYLFDPELGIALPGPTGQGIATLSQVVADPQVLNQLTLGEEFVYPVTANSLSAVAAWIDASSQSISQRMTVIESRLTGEHRMRLTLSPTNLKRQLDGLPGISAVKLWKTPLEAELYFLAREDKRKRDSGEDARWQMEMAIFSNELPIMENLYQGRQLYFRHQFEEQQQKPGAAAKYLAARSPEESIRNLPNNKEMQRQLGLDRRPGEPEQTWLANLRVYQALFQSATENSSYWLGQMHYENGDYDSAVNWFLNRNLHENSVSPWAPSARYNLGRAYEAQHNYAAAREQYLSDNSLQKHGNMLRARWLRERVEAAGADGSASSP